MAGNNDETEDLLFKVALAAGAYFFVVRPIMNELGVNPADTATVNSQINSSAASNPFSASFTPFVSQYQSNWSSSAGFTEQAYFAQFQQAYNDGQTSLNGSTSDLAVYAETINNSFGYILHDTNTVMAIFNELQYQTDVAWISAYLYYNYQKDLLSLLTNGAWTLFGLKSGLSDTDLATCINHVLSLPQSY
jgi:hypothetical protein